MRRRALFHQQGLHFSSAILQVARLTNSSLLGDNRNISVAAIGQRAESPFNVLRNPENDSHHVDGSHANIVLERNYGRNQRSSQPRSVYPFSIGNLGSFSVDGGTRMFDNSRNQRSGLSSLIPNSPVALLGDLGDGRRTVGIDADEGVVSGQDRIRSMGWRMFRESRVSVGEATQSGPFTSLWSVLPWILGTGPATLVSFLPIFREFRVVHQHLATAVTTEQEREDSALPGGFNNDLRLRRRAFRMAI